MKSWQKNGLIALGVGAASAAAVAYIARRNWRAQTTRSLAQLRASHEPAQLPDLREGFDELPAIVQRYFEVALPENPRPIRWAQLLQEGEIRTEVTAPWQDFEANQCFQLHPPGFVWDARAPMLPGLPILIRDSYDDGRGSMQASIGGLVPVVNAAGRIEMGKAALQRYLCEAVWFPTALLPSAGVRWEAIDERWARATLEDRGVRASVEFRFGLEDTIVESYVPARPRALDNGSFLWQPWGGKYWNVHDIDGWRIPLDCEVRWEQPDGDFVYFHGSIRDLHFDFDR